MACAVLGVMDITGACAEAILYLRRPNLRPSRPFGRLLSVCDQRLKSSDVTCQRSFQ